MTAHRCGPIQCFSKGNEAVRHSCCSVVNVEHTVYHFCLSDGHHKWSIAKRYSEFDQLDTELQNRFPKKMLKVDKLPAKAVFGSMSASRVLTRQKALDAFLRVLLREDVLLASPELREFLEFPIEAALSDPDHDDGSSASAERHSPDSLLTSASLAATVRAAALEPLTPGSARVAAWQAETEAKWGSGRGSRT
ncbi:Phox homologous domain-containing protein [Baffinella frigidus]|nr:Phox homologous domain-containing protein [Cryptophyta sp. CCMP2293]|mmetsp:Transcript_29035/g.69282  ORF Transcript_29035/g.69282 Transcript_29035/m.69282 type:complete len:193 (+) Transcript_29035:144-722(+)